MNTLCIDIGNTLIKYFVFCGAHAEVQSEKILRSSKLRKKLIRELVDEFDINHIAVSSVRKSTPSSSFDWGDKVDSVLILDHNTHIPITNLYKTPKTLGNDRLAGIIGANEMYPDENCLVIDFGTCIKYDFINKKNQYLGGNIAPGAMMRIQAMHEFTSQLPMVKMEFNENMLGESTETALQNGAIRGTLYEVKAFVESIKEKYGNLNIIFTGGNAEFFASYINIKIFVHQNLVLQGLHRIIQFNKNK